MFGSQILNKAGDRALDHSNSSRVSQEGELKAVSTVPGKKDTKNPNTRWAIKKVQIVLPARKTEMAKIFETGMGVDVPESMKMCKSVPKLHLKSFQRSTNYKRDSSLRSGSLKLSYPEDDNYSDFKGIKMVDTSKMLNYNLNLKQKTNMVSEFNSIF